MANPAAFAGCRPLCCMYFYYILVAPSSKAVAALISAACLCRYGYDKAGAAPVAVALHQRAAAQGNVEALLSIGDSYYYGRGVARDWQRAAQVNRAFICRSCKGRGACCPKFACHASNSGMQRLPHLAMLCACAEVKAGLKSWSNAYQCPPMACASTAVSSGRT